MLPDCLVKIVEEYIAEIHQLESLPEVSSITRLIQKSNHFLTRVSTMVLGVPHSVILEIVHREEFNEPYFLQIVMNPFLLADFNTCLMFSMENNYATSSLFWLFIAREPSIYFGPYAKLFENSLLFKLLNFVVTG